MNKSMNKKLLAIAVSAAVMAPVASQADVTVYGRIHQTLEYNDTDSKDSTTNISGGGSRFGFKASSDLGNGLTASAQYEFGTTTDRKAKIGALRVGTVGLSGAFGSVTVGNQWSTYFNTIGTHIDPTYYHGSAVYSGFVGGPYRSSNTIKYANSFGPLSLSLDLRVNDSDTEDLEKLAGDGFGIGLSFTPTDNLTLAVAYDSEEGDVTKATKLVEATEATMVNDVLTKLATVAVPAKAATKASDTDRLGLAAKLSFDGFFVQAAWQENEIGPLTTDQIALYGGVDIGATRIMLGYQDANKEKAGKDASVDQLIFGVYHSLGGGLKLAYEGTSISYDNHVDDDDNKVNDSVRHTFGMRYDF